MRLIDADEVQKIIDHIRVKYVDSYGRRNKVSQFFWDTVRYIEKKVRSIPTVDAVPVVRCKDCVHWGNKIKHGSFLDVKQCDFHGTRRECEYCSDGEKVQE